MADASAEMDRLNLHRGKRLFGGLVNSPRILKLKLENQFNPELRSINA
jgi:hypothetical protein